MLRTCMVCGKEFTLLPSHIGYATKCSDCNSSRDVERVGAEIRWEGKHTPVIEIVASLAQARKFNRKGARLGASVLRNIVPRSPTPFSDGDTITKEEHQNKPGASYKSSLGERHTTKR